MALKLKICSQQKNYEYTDSWWDLISECSYKVINILETKWDFKIELNSEEQIKEITLSKEQMNNLYLFLQNQKEAKNNLTNIQCSEFCDIINWVEYFTEYDKNCIKIEKISNIKKWESLVICETWMEKNNFQIDNNIFIKKPFFHFAIYIWEGLYISKFWKWNIYITTFEEMHKIYNHSNFYILTKKEN